jgi:hypothetical protein
MKYDENSASEQFLNMFKESIDALAKLSTMKPTFCGELDHLARKGASDRFETVTAHYTASGTLSVVKDKNDGQEYTIEIKPLKKGK